MRQTTSIRLGFVKRRREESGCHFWQVNSMIATIAKRRPSFWGVISPMFGASRVSVKQTIQDELCNNEGSSTTCIKIFG